MEKETIVKTDAGYIKLYKMTKVYNWEIKLFEEYDEAKYQEIIDTLHKLDKKMHDTFNIDYGED